MTYPEDPPRWPMRTHTSVYVVRWRYRHWVTDSDGCYRWHTRWYVSNGPAHDLARKLKNSGAVVHTDAYRTEFLHRIDWNNSDVRGPGQLGDDQ
jgi:hypothetical protein